MPKKPVKLDLTLEITRSVCTVRVFGRRSTKGWNVSRIDGARSDHQGHRKSKNDAIQLALDCCEPGVTAVFAVKAAN